MDFEEILEASLLPRLLYALAVKPVKKHSCAITNFRKHLRLLGEYLRNTVVNDGKLSIDFLIGLHIRLYPPEHLIVTTDDTGNPIKIRPGAWRQKQLRDNPLLEYRWFTSSSSIENIESDLHAIIAKFNSIAKPSRQDILRFFFEFLGIHPFSDANGRVASIAVDALCALHLQKPFFPQNSSFNNKNAYWRLFERYEDDSSEPALIQLLEQIDTFNLRHKLPRIIDCNGRNEISLGGWNAPYLACFNETDRIDRVFDRLCAEIRNAIDVRDMPIACALLVNDQILLSARNTVHSQRGQRFHAERNLLAQLAVCEIPAGRRVLYVTLEPCLRCAQAIARFGVDEVVYVLEDPFRGGRAILEQAGIRVTRRPDWEEVCLELALEFFRRYPEFCAIPQYPYAFTAMQRHRPAGRSEWLRTIFLRQLSPYLPEVVPARWDEVRRMFHAHVDQLVALTQAECVGQPTAAFIVRLHRSLYPPAHYPAISAPERIESELAALLAGLPEGEAFRREDALRFFFNFLAMRPFADGNGRLAAILADVLCLNHGRAPLFIDIKNELFRTALWEDVRAGAPVDHQLFLVDAWNRGQLGIRPRSIYAEQTTAFDTYARRCAGKQHVLAHVIERLAERVLMPDFVVVDVGAGTGTIANGLLTHLSQQNGLPFTYHFVEPHQPMVDLFRAHSPHAALPALCVHVLPLEDFLLPHADLIIASQSLQYVQNLRESLADMVAALKPGGEALIVVSMAEGDEWAMVSDLMPLNSLYPRLKSTLDELGISYQETRVDSPVRIAAIDRDTPAGDDLLTFYLRSPAHAIQPELKEAFWANVSKYAPTGILTKREAFFWLREGT